MNTDDLGSALKDAASDWTSLPFDAAQLRELADERSHHIRRRTLAVSLATLLVAGIAAGTISVQHAHGNNHSQAVPESPHGNRPPQNPGLAPGAPPPIVMTVLGATSERVDHQRVLARTPTGTPVTVRARLSFRSNRPARVHDTAIVIARPGTPPAASPGSTGDYYRSSRVAVSPRISATFPQQRTLTVTTPAGLPAGNYPVLTVVRNVLLPGQHRGTQGPFQESSELGIIIVTSP